MRRIVNLLRANWIVISLILLAVITILSLTPLPKLPSAPGSDKLHHFIAYGALIFPLMLKKPHYWPWVFSALAAWSGGIELVQPYANRFGEWADMFANVGGLICGTIAASLVNFYYPVTEQVK